MAGIRQILTDEINRDKSPSVQYFFFDKDKIIESFQYGLADIANQRTVNIDTTYNAFSVTKTFTALAILQLAERGMVDINQSAIKYLPEFLYGAAITVKQILSHTAGIPNPIPLAWIHLASEQDYFDRNIFFRKIFDKYRNVKSKPGERFSYSNLGYVILGQLIERITGKTYEQYIFEHIIQKLSIDPSNLTFTIADYQKHAKGYHREISFSNLILGFFIDKRKFMGQTEKGWRVFKNFYVNGASYGGLIGTPIAFIKYIQGLMMDESDLISNAYKQVLFEENNNTGMCLSWFAGAVNGKKYFAHPGGGGGYYCEVRIYPHIKRGSVIFFNRTGMSNEKYLDKLDKFYI